MTENGHEVIKALVNKSAVRYTWHPLNFTMRGFCAHPFTHPYTLMLVSVRGQLKRHSHVTPHDQPAFETMNQNGGRVKDAPTVFKLGFITGAYSDIVEGRAISRCVTK